MRTKEWLYKTTIKDFYPTTTRYKQHSTLSNVYVPDEKSNIPEHSHPCLVETVPHGVMPLTLHQTNPLPAVTEPQQRILRFNENVLWDSNKIIGVSDSSVDPLTGAASYSWIITNEEETGCINRTEPTETDPENMTSYRGELAGVHCMVTHLVKNNKTHLPLELWCDNESVLKAINPTVDPTFVSLCKAEGALVHQTKLLLRKFDAVTLKHVKGHQDDDTPYELLPLPARLNVVCDRRAKVMMQKMELSKTKPPPPEGSTVALYLRNALITTNLDQKIQFAKYSEDMFKYLCDKFEWVDRQTSEINWKAIGLAKRRLSHAESIRVSKLMHEWLNLGHQKKKIHGSETDALCPCCGTAHEDQDHMFQCQSEPTRAAVSIGLHDMEEAFRKDNVPLW